MRQVQTALRMVCRNLASPASQTTVMTVSDGKTSYEQAVAKLNTLQTNASVLERAKKDKDKFAARNVPETEECLAKLGILPSDLDKLNVIHVAGTKGKGSTCAFSEAILRCHNLKTGFYSSPHLISVRERIRINGQPLSREKFSHYFWEVYRKLENAKSHEDDMPSYFKFLTVLAFNVFLQEQVDVAVLEVGIGGQFDCTNVVRHPVVCGITSLGLDHTSILGDTVDRIAWHKSGIIKPGIPAFSSPQPEEAMEVIRDRASEKETEIYFVPPLEAYRWGAYPPHLGLHGEIQKINASLALQLTQHWLSRKLNGPLTSGCEPFRIPWQSALGLRVAKWPGRCQTIRLGKVFYLLDGAHTSESLAECSDWYARTSEVLVNSADVQRDEVLKVLVFNATGDRCPRQLLGHLIEHKWDYTVFTTNVLDSEQSNSSDVANFQVSRQSQLKRLEENQEAWLSLKLEMNHVDESNPENSTLVFSYITEVLQWLADKELNDHYRQIQVLVTGSLHLVGGFLAAVQPQVAEEEESGAFKVLESHYKHLSELREISVPGTP